MKKIMTAVSFLFLIILVLAGCSTSANNDEDKKIDLIASSGLGEEHILHKANYQPVIDRVEEETDGQVNFTTYTSEELVDLDEHDTAIEDGTIDVALSFMSQYESKDFPYTEVTLLPSLNTDVEIATNAVVNLMDSEEELADGKTFYELEFEDKDLVAFPNVPTEAYVLSTTGAKFEKPEDFNQKVQIRSSSRIHNLLGDNLGISTLSMPITDAYDALNRKTLDGLLYNVPDWKSLGFAELMDYTIEGTSFGHFFQQTVMTKDTWDELPSDVQDIYSKAQEEIIYDGIDMTDEDTEEVKKENIDNGGEFVDYEDLDEDVQEHIESAIVATWEEWIEDLESQGHEGKKIAILWRDLIVDEGGEFPEEIMDLEE